MSLISRYSYYAGYSDDVVTVTSDCHISITINLLSIYHLTLEIMQAGVLNIKNRDLHNS